MREHLLGYLLDALDESERDQVESRLKEDPRLQRELEVLQSSLEPLDSDNEAFEAPGNLAHRTCAFVAAKASGGTAVAPASGGARQWRLVDMTVAFGVVAASAFLFFPAIMQSRIAAGLDACSDNLRVLGAAMKRFSAANNGSFPAIAAAGNESAAGIYAVRLVHDGFLDEPSRVICPASPLADDKETFSVPTLAALNQASGETLRRYQRMMGGSYGYSLGHMDKGCYRCTRDQSRKSFAIMADAFDPLRDQDTSGNHGACGQNVLYEDGHVARLTTCIDEDCSDDIFHNEQGSIAPGLHSNDAVIGHSAVRPMVHVTAKVADGQ